MIIYAKPGTHPAKYLRVKSKRKPPKQGDIFLAKCSLDTGPGSRWEQYRVCEIKGGIYFLERW